MIVFVLFTLNLLMYFVGFKYKSHPDCPAGYVEWQFITAQGLRFD